MFLYFCFQIELRMNKEMLNTCLFYLFIAMLFFLDLRMSGLLLYSLIMLILFLPIRFVILNLIAFGMHIFVIFHINELNNVFFSLDILFSILVFSYILSRKFLLIESFIPSIIVFLLLYFKDNFLVVEAMSALGILSLVLIIILGSFLLILIKELAETLT